MTISTKKVLFSPVTGVVTKDGAPVKNAVVQRYHRLLSDFAEDETRTNESGQFFFPSIQKPVFAFESKVYQHISIIHDRQVYIVWKFNKPNLSLNGELDGWAMHLLCDLGEPEIDHDLLGYHGLTKVFNARFDTE